MLKYKRTPTLYNELVSLVRVLNNPRQLRNTDLKRLILKSRLSEYLKQIIIRSYQFEDIDDSDEYDSDETIAEDG